MISKRSSEKLTSVSFFLLPLPLLYPSFSFFLFPISFFRSSFAPVFFSFLYSCRKFERSEGKQLHASTSRTLSLSLLFSLLSLSPLHFTFPSTLPTFAHLLFFSATPSYIAHTTTSTQPIQQTTKGLSDSLFLNLAHTYILCTW